MEQQKAIMKFYMTVLKNTKDYKKLNIEKEFSFEYYDTIGLSNF